MRKGIELEQPNDLEVQGIIKSFEFSFELAWKTLQDYLEAQGIQATFPREVIKSAFQHSVLDQGEMQQFDWLDDQGKMSELTNKISIFEKPSPSGRGGTTQVVGEGLER